MTETPYSFRSDSEREEWFLARLEDDSVSPEALTDFLATVQAEGPAARAVSWSELLEDALSARHRPVDALQVLWRRAEWAGDGPGRLGAYRERALQILGEASAQAALVAHAGFGGDIKPREAIRRLLLLLSLREGALCQDKTWGFGIVRRVDTFYGRVEIDFDGRRGHEMSLGYAAEALELLGEGHLLARLHRERDRMVELVREHPAEIVRITLRSYGPVTAARLQEILVPRLVESSAWKAFWDAARPALKKDPLVEMPSKRTDPIRLLDAAPSHDAAWFGCLGAERDIEVVLSRIEQLAASGEALPDAAGRAAVEDRIAFVVRAVAGKDHAIVARAAMAAHALGISEAAVRLAAETPRLFEPDVFIEATRNLPVRQVAPFVQFLVARDASRLALLLLANLNRLPLPALTEGIEYLASLDREAPCAAALQDLAAALAAEVEVVYWMCRNPDRVAEWALCSRPKLAQLALDELAKDYSGDRLKVKNQLRARFEQMDWLAPALEGMTPGERRDLVARLREMGSWPALDRQSLLAKIIKAYPDLESAAASRDSRPSAAVARPRVTSWRSYRERQAQLEKIVTLDIPQNSREIAVARSYGDLSENHEYKAAKEMQGILLRRRGEIEALLREVRPTDFRGVPLERVGAGTGARIRFADGRTEQYFILGEWDQDTALGIVSSGTRMAQALEGKAAGAETRVPTAAGEESCRVVEVLPLSPEIQAWLNGS